MNAKEQKQLEIVEDFSNKLLNNPSSQFNKYMVGLFNGINFAVATIKGEEKFKQMKYHKMSLHLKLKILWVKLLSKIGGFKEEDA